MAQALEKYNARAYTITASSTEDEILCYVIAISAGTTSMGLMELIKDLPVDKNTKKLGSLSLGCSMSVKKVMNSFRTTAGITLPDGWMVNNEVNFSLLAMLGHILWLYDKDNVTSIMEEHREAYVKSLGGVDDITKFHQGVDLGEKEKRHEICLKWQKQLKNFDKKAHQELLAKKFPNLIKSSLSWQWKAIFNLWSIVTSPFRAAYYIVSLFFRPFFASPTAIFLSLLFFAFIVYFANFTFLFLAPNTTAYLTTGGTSVEGLFTPMDLTSAGTMAFTRSGIGAMSVITSSPDKVSTGFSTVASAAGKVMAFAPTAYSFLREGYETKGASMRESVESMDLASFQDSAQEYAVFAADASLGVFADLFALKPIPGVMTEEFQELLAGVIAAARIDYSLWTGDKVDVEDQVILGAEAAVGTNAGPKEDEEEDKAEDFVDLSEDAMDAEPISSATERVPFETSTERKVVSGPPNEVAKLTPLKLNGKDIPIIGEGYVLFVEPAEGEMSVPDSGLIIRMLKEGVPVEEVESVTGGVFTIVHESEADQVAQDKASAIFERDLSTKAGSEDEGRKAIGGTEEL